MDDVETYREHAQSVYKSKQIRPNGRCESTFLFGESLENFMKVNHIKSNYFTKLFMERGKSYKESNLKFYITPSQVNTKCLPQLIFASFISFNRDTNTYIISRN